ncbi:MAG: hypothetical protein Kow00128_04500 [Deltaproteobacteria bacterium]
MAVEKLSRTMERLLAGAGLPSVSVQVALARSWRRIAGPILGERTAPGRFRHGLLTVRVPNASWAQEMQLSKPVLLDRIRECLGSDAVRDVRFETGAASPPSAEPPPAGPDAPEPEPLPPLRAPEEIGKIADPELRALFRSILEKSTRRNR